MQSNYNEKDLVSFGNYLLSEERKISYKQNPNFPNEERLEERLSEVSHADLCNCTEKQKTSL